MTLRSSRPRAFALALCAVLLPSASARAQEPPRTGEAVVQAMHDRYASVWYKTMTFVQRTTFAGRPDQTWYETVEVPGKLRIDVAPVDSMNAFMFIGDSTFVFRRGQRAAPRAAGNVLAVLIMDAFTAPVPATVARLRTHGFDLSRVSSGTFRGRRTWIVGATGGDTTVSQFWLDAERLHLVRVIEAASGQPLTDIHVLGHRQMNGVWVEHEIRVLRGGVEVQGEYYSEVKLDPPVEPDVWNTTRWVRPAWIPSLTPDTRLDVVNGRALWVEYRGQRALHLVPRVGQEQATDQEIYAVLAGSDFTNGTIEIDVAGARRKGYASDDVSAFKGFVGMSFRVRGDTAERIYLRPENSRLESQLFRNRSTQYEASPDFPWQQLRQQSPGQYESYVDVEAGAWTHLRIDVEGPRARLYVNGARQPTLVVNDLKHGESRGALALWTRISADAYFANLSVTPKSTARALPGISEVVNGRSEVVTHRGRRAVHLIPSPELKGQDKNVLAILDFAEFRNGSIEIDVAGTPRPGAPPDSRGFVGIAFRTGPHGEWSEVMYLRPTNGRADDQLRRNRSVQYAFDPEYPWHRLRRESPGAYESYADLEDGAWTRMRIEVAGTTARLFVNDDPSPSLVVTDLKGGDRAGRIALWAHVETDAHFGEIRVTPR